MSCLLIAVIVFVALICVSGILAAIAIPAFIKYTRRAKATEAIANIALLCRNAGGYYAQSMQFPPSAPRTPMLVPAGIRAVDPPGSWTQGGWPQLGFALVEPHYYSYEFINSGSTFTVRAYGDLDGNGRFSTFQRSGQATPQGVPVVCSPMVTNAEAE